jgi:hypothetical protein
VLTLPEKEVIRFFALSPDDRFVIYVRNGNLSRSPGLWLGSLDGSVHRALDWNMKAGIGRVEWSPDGRHLALDAATGTSEFWVMENFWPEAH